MVPTEDHSDFTKSHEVVAGPSRTALEDVATSLSARLSRISSAPSLSCLTREARYARDEAALRLALSRCDTEPSPLELQVRVMEKGLQAWNARAGRGYERVQRAEEAIVAIRREEENSNVPRGSLSDIQREKWMGMKERDEALAMVDKIKGLIAELHAEIRRGSRASTSSKPTEAIPFKDLGTLGPILVNDTPSKKATILFSGKFPPPYLERLPRSRRSVEPLRLPLKQSQMFDNPGRKRSSTLRSDQTNTVPSTPTSTQPSTPPKTPTNEFGAAVIYSPLPPKTPAQYLSDIVEEDGRRKDFLGHTRLPSYVGTLLEELTEDRIGTQQLCLSDASSYLAPLSELRHTPMTSQGFSSPASPRLTLKRRSRNFLGRHSHSSPPHSKENLDPSQISRPEMSLHAPFALDTVPSSAPTPTTSSDGVVPIRNAHTKSSSRMETMMQSVKKSVMKVSRIGE